MLQKKKKKITEFGIRTVFFFFSFVWSQPENGRIKRKKKKVQSIVSWFSLGVCVHKSKKTILYAVRYKKTITTTKNSGAASGNSL